MILYSPSEPADIRDALMGRTSAACEERGCDYLIRGTKMLLGIQRKRTPDLLSSVTDGRLQREVVQMTKLDYPVLLHEGRPQFSPDGIYMQDASWTRQAIRNLLLSVQLCGIGLITTDDIPDTIARLQELHEYVSSEHKSLLTRPKYLRGSWGQPSRRAEKLFMLQGFPGIGATLAENILDHFGGLPFSWDCTREELLRVEGLGEKRVERILAHLEE